MSKLKPCPFCGGEAEYERFASPRNFYSVRCTSCGCRTDGYRDNRTESTDAENKTRQADIWNRRVEELPNDAAVKDSLTTQTMKGMDND